MDNLESFQKECLFDPGPEANTNFRRAIKCDMRQTYFHAIETFFELFFALNPKGKTRYDDAEVLTALTNSQWRKNQSKIEQIAIDINALNFFDEVIDFYGHKVSIGNYLFYMGIFPDGNFPKEVLQKISESIEAIKLGIRLVANDFLDRQEYNSYKHGLRIIPSIQSLTAVDAETLKHVVTFDLTDSMSYYSQTKDKKEITVNTRTLDFERDFQMASFCSNLIHHMIYFRRAAFKFPNDLKEDGGRIKITFFCKEEIEKCTKYNVDISEMKYTTRI